MTARHAVLCAVVVCLTRPVLCIKEPTWEAHMPSSTVCTVVPAVKAHNFSDNSRWTFTAVPSGKAPPSGWPVLIQLAIIPFSGPNTTAAHETSCAKEKQYAKAVAASARMPRTADVLPYWKCNQAMMGVCGRLVFREYGEPPEQFGMCMNCSLSNEAVLKGAGCTKLLLEQVCTAPTKKCYSAVLDGPCANLTEACSKSADPKTSAACKTCETCAFTDPATAQDNCSFALTDTACGDNEMGGHSKFTEDYSPFDSPAALMDNCTCFANNGSYVCGTIADHGHHEEPRAHCSFDMLAGAMWFQRQKQYLLANGIAVMTVNTREFDGWNIDVASWKIGEDPPLFDVLAKEMSKGTYGKLDPHRVAFHGWSGGAQMVSNLAHQWAAGQLPGLTMKAGVMMSGGSQQCYNVPPLASAQCAKCDASPKCMTPGCSAASPNGKGQAPCCNMCCPQGLTEAWYRDHPDDYSRHPAMFLGQVEHDDVQADGCAAKYYHEAMQAHNATSELHLVPLEEQRCFAIGQPDDPSCDKAAGGKDKYARFCDGPAADKPDYTFNSMNHTTGAASMVIPLVKFLMKVL